MSATESQNGLRELGVITVQRIQNYTEEVFWRPRQFGGNRASKHNPPNLEKKNHDSSAPHTYVCRFGCSSAFNRFGAPLRIREKDGMHHISFE